MFLTDLCDSCNLNEHISSFPLWRVLLVLCNQYCLVSTTSATSTAAAFATSTEWSKSCQRDFSVSRCWFYSSWWNICYFCSTFFSRMRSWTSQRYNTNNVCLMVSPRRCIFLAPTSFCLIRQNCRAVGYCLRVICNCPTTYSVVPVVAKQLLFMNRFYHECGIFGQTDRTDKLRTYAGLG